METIDGMAKMFCSSDFQARDIHLLNTQLDISIQ